MQDDVTAERNRTILYYPTIAVPEGPWLKQALLYWDEISSIVPMRWDDRRKKEVPAIPFTPDVERLHGEEVFRPIQPSSFFELEEYFVKLEQFSEELKRIVSSRAFRHTIPKEADRLFTARIHHDKVSREVIRFLEKEKLARAPEGGSEWCGFEHHTGLSYMALLAKYLADVDPKHTMPGTDLKIYESLVFDSPSLREGFSCLDVRYRNALPIPREDVSIGDILEFKKKKKNRQALLRFRSLLDQVHEDLSGVEKPNAVDQTLAAFREKIEYSLSELTEHLKESAIETVSGCLKTIVNVKSPTLWGVAGVVADRAAKIADVPLEWAIPGIAFAAAIEVGHKLIHSINQRRATIRESDFSYLYHADEWGII